MGYTLALANLSRLTDEEFRAIPPCNRAVVEVRDTSKIICKEQAWLYELCRDLPPSKEDASAIAKPWPKYIPELAIKKGGEALLIKAYETWRAASIVLKIPFPLALHDTQRIRKPETAQPSRIVRSAKEMLAVAQGLIYRKLEPPKKKNKIEIEEEQKQKHLDESSLYKRFHRAFMVQEQLHKKAVRTDPAKQYGYIPKTYEFGFHPRCFAAMEFVDGRSYLDYLREHGDEQNLALFLKLVIFVEKVLHALGVAHCDLTPKNILVVADTPVLLDFGIVKCPALDEITLAGAQLGSIAYAAPEQMTDARSRNFLTDVFILGARLLWTTVTRRDPPLEGLLLEYDDDGQIIYTPETLAAIDALFDKHFLPARYYAIFDKAHDGLYTDISEFRADLEGLLFIEERAPVAFSDHVCPCPALVELYKIVNLLVTHEEKP